MKDFSGRVAVVTGGASGIGRAICRALASRGVHVVVADIEAGPAGDLSAELRTGGARSVAVRTDVAKLSDVIALADVAYSEFGKVDLLFNHAGVNFRPFRTIWETSIDDLNWIVNTNLWGVLNGVHVFVPRMMTHAGEKHIVNTSSIAPQLEGLGTSAYSLTKAAVDAFSEVIQRELAYENIGVTVLKPGRVQTNVAESGRLRSAEQQRANAQVKGLLAYLEERGRGHEAVSGPAGSEAVHVNAGDADRIIEPEQVAEMAIAAIEQNRLYCLTHMPPVVSIDRYAAALKAGYVPL